MGDKRNRWSLDRTLACLYDLRKSPCRFSLDRRQANKKPDFTSPIWSSQMHPQESDRFGMPASYSSKSRISYPETSGLQGILPGPRSLPR